jgi:outer membrane protein assembly factor BamA
VAFSNYSSRGYDVHVAEVDFASAPAAEPFIDPYPASSPAMEPVAVVATPYRPLPVMLPRFWSPVVLRQDDQWHYGAAIAGTDPLFRHSYGVTAYAGSTSGEVSTLAFYQYDRFWPTFLATFEDEARLSGNIPYRNRIFNLRATFPVTRSFRSAQNVSLTWRRERQAVDEDSFQVTGALDRGGLEAAWAWSSTQQYAESISPVDGGRLRFAFLREDPAFGSELTLSKFTGDARGYVRLFGERDVVAFRVGGGTTRGERGFRRTFAVGGYPDSSIFDLVRANEALLRGYPDDAFSGRHFAQANVEYRFPLASPQRGWRTMPLFLRHLRGTVFFDAANAWNGDLQLGDVKTGAGASLGVDTYLAHRLPFVGEMALAHGFQSPGDTRLYFRVGLAF